MQTSAICRFHTADTARRRMGGWGWGQRLTLELLKKMDDSLKPAVLESAAFYEHRLQLGSKPIFHLEAFVAKVMALYKKWSIEFMEMMDD